MADMKRIIDIFRKYGDDYWTLRQQALFLEIAEAGKRGITMVDLTDSYAKSPQPMNLTQITKNCGYISDDPHRDGYKGYNLVTFQDDPSHHTRKVVMLTDKGLKMYKELQEELTP